MAGRVWFRLVSATPPPADALDRLVAAYGSRRDIRALLRAVTDEPAFRDSATSLVKQPVEWLAGLLRALGVRPAKLDDKTRAQLLAGLRGHGPGAVRAAQRRRLGGRRRLADDVGGRGAAARWRSSSPRTPTSAR